MQCGLCGRSGPPLPSPPVLPTPPPFVCCWVHACDLLSAGALEPLWLPPDLSEVPNAEEPVRFLSPPAQVCGRPRAGLGLPHVPDELIDTPGWPCSCPGLCLTQARVYLASHSPSARPRVPHAALCHTFPNSTPSLAPALPPQATGLGQTYHPHLLPTGFPVPPALNVTAA